MKRYCKRVDVTDRRLIERSVYKCLFTKNKYKRRDSIRMYSEYTGLSKDFIEGIIENFGKQGLENIIQTVIDGIRQEIIYEKINLKKIRYQTKVDPSSQKIREIGIQDVKQQIYDYIIVEAFELGGFLKRIGEYQCASIPERGQSYGVKTIKRWLRNKNIRYVGKCDIKKCFPSIKHEKIMEFLSKYIKNEKLLRIIHILIDTFKKGLSIGAFLSQYLCNLFLSILYHEISENMYRIRNKKNGELKRVNLVLRKIFYMDDIVIFGTNSRDLHKAMKLIIKKAKEIGLEVKGDWRIFSNKDENVFIDVMGYRIYRKRITIRKRVFLKIRKSFKLVRKLAKTHKKIPIKLARKCVSYFGKLKHSNSYKLIIKYKIFQIMKRCRRMIRHESRVQYRAKRYCYQAI